MSQLFASGGQSIGVSASTLVLPMNTQDWSPLGWTGWISLQYNKLSRVFSNTVGASVLQHSAFFIVQLSHPYMTTGKIIALTRRIFVGTVMSLLFNMLSRLVMGEGNDAPLQYRGPENPMDGGAWWAAVYGVTQSQTRLKRLSSSSHEIKRCLLLGKKAMTNLDSILKSRDITLSTQAHLVKTGFSSSHVWMWELDYKESWAPKN